MGKTHWKKLTNPDYLGAYSIEDKSVCNDELHICSLKAYFDEKPNIEGWTEIDTPYDTADEEATEADYLAALAELGVSE